MRTPAPTPEQTTCICEACRASVRWAIPLGVSPARFLAPIPCPACGKRALFADVPSELPTQPRLPGCEP